MSPDQRLLLLITQYGRELHVDDDGTWYAFTPGDVQEYGGAESPVGLQVKIGNRDGVMTILDVGSYNR